VNAQEKAEVLGNARLAMLKEIGKAWEADFLDEAISDIAEEALLKVGTSDPTKLDGMEEHYAEVQKFCDEVKKQFALEQIGTTFVYVAFDPIYGTHVELFSERPRTQSHGDPSDPENWGKWYRVYEGNINGGDSIQVDALGKDLFS